MTDTANVDRLQKDVSAVKTDISALTGQITDVINSLTGNARKQANRGYKQARASAEDAIGDISERGSAMMDAAQDAANIDRGNAGGRHHRAPARSRRSCDRPRLPDRRRLAPLRPTMRTKPNLWRAWQRWRAVTHFVDVLYKTRQADVSAAHR